VAERERRDFLIIGAGPAGLAAALEASRAGVDTCIVDLESRPGGRTPHHSVTRRLVRDVHDVGVEVRLNTAAWGIWGLTVATCPVGGHDHRVRGAHVLLATGARARPVVFPGWQLPGVTTYANASGRVVVAGSGPGLAARAVELHRRGLNVRGLVEASSAPSDVESETYLRSHRVILRNRRLLIRAEGAARVERAVFARIDADWRVQPAPESAFEVDSIVLDYGQVPCSELSRVSGCTHARIDVDSMAPRHDEWMRTDVPSLLVAGDLTGVRGPRESAEQGRLAGIGVAFALGRLTRADAERLAKPVRARLARLASERQRQWSNYSLGRGVFELAQPETVVCHCEDVTAAQIQAAIVGASRDPAPVRGETRAGMGICQARDCARQIEALVAREAGVALELVPPLSVRPPVVPIALGAIAERP
jgi:thioredoxin reductase